MAESDNAPSLHSQAFERLVHDEKDVTGLLAYALYKQAIREAARRGQAVHKSEHRNPVVTEVEMYRDAADARLMALAELIINEARAGIADTAVRQDLAAAEQRLRADIRVAANWRSAIASNLVAWLLSIAITFLIAVAGVPGWIIALITRLKGG